jgi:hypothetical protein
MRRGRFRDVVERQLELFETEQAGLIRACEVAERAYDRADSHDAEARYAEYLDLVETATEALADLRDNYAVTLDEQTAAEYEEAFNRAVPGRLPRFALEIEDT